MRDFSADLGKSAVRLEIRGCSITELARSCCLQQSFAFLITASASAPVDQTDLMPVARSKNKHVYIYVHGYKAVFENPLLVSTDRFGSDGSILDSVVTENLDFAHGEFHLIVRFSVD